MTMSALIGTKFQLAADVAAFDCQQKQKTMLDAGCMVTVEAFEPHDPAAHQHGDGFLVWLDANECGDPVEDMRPGERWFVADAEQLVAASAADGWSW
jgi:hypothetical protein